MSTTYSMVQSHPNGTTSTGLDQLVDAIHADNSLAGNNAATDILAGAAAADRLDAIIVEAARATGAAADGVFTATEVVAMNAWIRANRLAEWTALHGDDETAEETGFHRVQNDGADTNYRGQNLVNTVIDGVYHMGFQIQNGTFLNEDGNANATVDQVAGWLTQFWTDRATTGTGLDRAVLLIQADGGLAAKTSQADIAAGQDAANGLNTLIVQGIAATNAAADGVIDVNDVKAINTWIRADATRLARFTALHGDDETAEETGYHRVQNDGATTQYFGKNLVNTVLDGIYHIGFPIQGTTLLNEDGAANAALADVASWLTYFLTSPANTGTGLDRIVEVIKTDAGLARNTAAADINAGAGYANSLNQLVIQAINATSAMADGWITPEDLRAMNAWVRADATRLAGFIALHGDDETAEETGYHLVQNDGGTANYFGKNLINTVADGIYHFGFEIRDNTFLNEDGNANATLSDVGNWLNYFYKGSTWINGTGGADTLTGDAGAEEFVGGGGNDVEQAGAGDDLLWGGWGNDTLRGEAGNDILYGDVGDDSLDGGQGSDTYRVSGNAAGGFQGYDTYADTGTSGTDTLKAIGTGDVDIGLKGWGATTGIETVDASGATGTVRLVGDGGGNLLDFRATALVGTNIVLDGGWGNDTILGSAAADVIVGSVGSDSLDGGQGSDTYRVGRGTAADRITDNDATAGNTDTLVFAAGVAAEQLWFRRVGTDLEIRIIGTSDSVTVTNWYGGSASHIEQIRTTDGNRLLLDTKVDALVSAMSTLALPTGTTLSGTALTTLTPVFAASWGS